MSQSDRDYSEKRDYIRMRLEAPVTVHHAGREIPAVCLDLSSTGMQLDVDADLNVGDRVMVHIASEHNQLAGLKADAEVVRVAPLENGRQAVGLTIHSMN
ncbi:PilZ domain-containing protein [Pseudomonas cuatrocienegasensis]|uniref:PilZ domain-containing protein n=1 Tax=Pseudomonas cuatrocienegasensis TaxID=543360 RepID=A0ABY1BPV3_9PSED|nr:MULTISPECIES: PilZ domain-containing protein [Pseudomonas]OEC32774.1 pilus assembly protein [Pseudomonas sp. 21C1]SER33696.1 PilZ domain-containing protein [Pseudomonas cuatrocienegasensis]